MWKVIVVHIALVALVHAATVDYDKNIFKDFKIKTINWRPVSANGKTLSGNRRTNTTLVLKALLLQRLRNKRTTTVSPLASIASVAAAAEAASPASAEILPAFQELAAFENSPQVVEQGEVSLVVGENNPETFEYPSVEVPESSEAPTPSTEVSTEQLKIVTTETATEPQTTSTTTTTLPPTTTTTTTLAPTTTTTTVATTLPTTTTTTKPPTITTTFPSTATTTFPPTEATEMTQSQTTTPVPTEATEMTQSQTTTQPPTPCPIYIPAPTLPPVPTAPPVFNVDFTPIVERLNEVDIKLEQINDQLSNVFEILTLLLNPVRRKGDVRPTKAGKNAKIVHVRALSDTKTAKVPQNLTL